MTQDVGDRGLVFGVGGKNPVFVEVQRPSVGDKVILYPLGDGDKLAVPELKFEVGDVVWATPDNPWAPFEWNMPFDIPLISFNLLPCVSTLTAIGADYVEDDKKAWTTDELIGLKLFMLSGTNKNTKYDLSSNTETKYYPVLTSALDLDFESNAFGTWEIYPTSAYQAPVFDGSTKKHGSYSIKCQVSGSVATQYSGIRQIGDFSAVSKIGIWWLGQIDKHSSPWNGPYIGDLDLDVCGNWRLLDEWVLNGSLEQNPDYPNFSYFEFSISGLTSLTFGLNRNGGTKNGFVNIDYIQLFDSDGNLIENLLEGFTVGDRYVIWDETESKPYCGYAARLTKVDGGILTDGYRSWTSNALIGKQIELLTGPNSGSKYDITANTKTTYTTASTGCESGNWYKIWDPTTSTYTAIT